MKKITFLFVLSGLFLIIPGCKKTESPEPDPVVKDPYAMFKYSKKADGIVSFTNTSTNATSYLWNFGDGETSTSAALSIEHQYLKNGDYHATLTAYGNGKSAGAYADLNITTSVEPPPTNKQLFLVACTGSAKGSYSEGLYTAEVASPAPKFEFITEYYPWAKSMNYVDYNNGRIAFNVDNPPEGKSCVAYMDVDNLKNVRFVPIPSAEPGWICTVSKSSRPAVLNDGRIAYHVVFRRDVYEDHHEGQLAIYDPVTESIELSGDPSAFVLAQPEQGSDTEAGSMNGHFALSKDGRYLYCGVYGYGTDWGSYHEDYNFIVKYTIGDPFSYARIAQTDYSITGITGDGNYLVVGGKNRINLSTLALDEDIISSGGLEMREGQAAQSSSRAISIYRGVGLVLYDVNSTSAWVYDIILQDNMQHDYNGLGWSACFSKDDSKVYFTGSTDFYTNYRTDLVLFSSPVMENNVKPDSLTLFPVEFCNNFFLLLSE
jgi:PKD repeat protein